MKTGLLACLSLLVINSTHAQQPPRHAKYPRWITSYDAARGVARAEAKPLFVVLRCEP